MLQDLENLFSMGIVEYVHDPYMHGFEETAVILLNSNCISFLDLWLRLSLVNSSKISN